ncbi:MAG: hypothetical protein ACI841_001386 [Planctomycetota bacterium]|jgi:hypothetical protein
MDPHQVLEEARTEIGDLLLFVTGYPPSDIPEVFENLSANFSTLGVCKLLISGEGTGFRSSLTQSGNAHRFLMRNLGPDAGQLHLALTRTSALFDTLAAGALKLAHELATLSATHWVATREYEEDFLYRRVLCRLIVDGQAAVTEAREICDAIETVQEGSSTRLEICRALVGLDSEAFCTALNQLAHEYRDDVATNRPLTGEANYLFWGRSFINVEALGLMQLARHLGMVLDCGEVALCPAHAQLDVRDAEVEDMTESAHQIRLGNR